jgi:hypothetical protein
MTRTTEPEQRAAAPPEPLPEYQPWREVGWIFRDGGCVAIERQGAEIRTRVLVD